MMRTIICFACMLFFGQIALAAQSPVAMQQFQEVPLMQFDGKESTLEEVRRDVIAAATRFGWTVQGSTENSVTFRHEKRNFHVDILVSFTTRTAKIEYLDSDGLGYAKGTDGVAIIHPNYNRWIANLHKAIAPTAKREGSQGYLNAEPQAIPDGYLVLHYHRNGGDYHGWGLHVWGSAFEQETSWFKPVLSNRSDAFGAIYLIKASTAQPLPEDAQANFVIHKGDVKDNCNQDKSWDFVKSKVVYMVSEDCRVYYTAEEAMKSSYYR